MNFALRISLAGLALAATFLAVVGGTSYFVLRHEIAGNASRTLERESAIAAADIAEQFRRIRGVLKTLADNALIADAVIDGSDPNAYLPLFLESFRTIGGIPVSVILTNRTGTAIAASQETPKVAVPRTWVAEAIRRGEPEAWIVTTEAGSFLIISQIVMLADTGSAGGALVAVVPLRQVEPLNWDVRTHSLQGWLVERNPDGQNVTLGPPFNSSGEVRRTPGLEAVSAIATLPVDALLAPLNLGVMVSADPDTLFAPLHRLQRLFTIVGLAMTAAVSGLCFWGGRRLTAPLRELEAAIRSVVDTKSFDHRAAIRGRDEVSRLATAFNRMLDHLTSDAMRRRASEQALRESEARFRSLIDNAPAGIHLKDFDGRYLVVNDEFARYANVKAEAMVGKTNNDFSFPAEVRTPADRAARRVMETGARQSLHLTFTLENGEARYVLSTKFAVRDAAGNVAAIGTINTDVTDYKALQEQLVQAQKMEAIGQLTGGLAHDFNNLLAIVIGNLDILEADTGLNPESQELVQAALDASLRGAELTRQLLAFARRQSLETKAFDLNDLVTSTAGLLRRTLGEQIEVEMVLADELRFAVADPTQVESALTNLAINARDAMPNGGRLMIETANKYLDEFYAGENAEVVPGDYVMLAVSDTGDGIPPEILSRVFDPFFTTKEQGKGTGLGLSMIYGFAKQSGGHVKIYSEIGHGTTVRLYLPADRDEAVAEVEDKSTGEAGAAGGATILVVEDNAEVRRVVARQLAELGYEVVEAGDGATALAMLQREQAIDLLFTDVVMPGGMTGVDLAREARKLRPTLKVLLTSGFTEMSLQNGHRPDEVQNLLSKPYRRQDLARKLREIFS